MTYYNDLIALATAKGLDVEQMKKDIVDAATVMGGMSLESVAESILHAIRGNPSAKDEMERVWKIEPN